MSFRSCAFAFAALAVSIPSIASQARDASPRPPAPVGAIVGRVVNDAGAPVAGAAVSALRRDTTPNRRNLVAAGRQGATDERGQFRIDNLPSGDYFLCGSDGEPRSPARRSTSFHPRLAYVPTCYPGAASIEGAHKVAVRAGEETAGAELALVQARLGRVMVTARDSLGRPLLVPQTVLRQNNGGVTLAPKGRDWPLYTATPVNPEPGRFVFSDVLPGHYYAVASLPRFLDSGIVEDRGFAEVTVDGDDVEVSVQMNTGATLAGRVVREGPPPHPLPVAARSPVPSVTITTLPDKGRGTPPFSPGITTVGEDGSFEITGARGRFFLRVWSPTGTLKAIRRAGQDVTGQPFTLTGAERIDDIEVVLTTETGRVAGVVRNSSGQPASSAWVIVFPDDPRRWHPGSASVAYFPTVSASMTRGRGRPDDSRPGGLGRGAATPGLPSASLGPGSFVTALPPGRYYVAALEGYDVKSFPGYDAGLLQELLPKATPVDVVAGRTANVEVGVVR